MTRDGGSGEAKLALTPATVKAHYLLLAWMMSTSLLQLGTHYKLVCWVY